MAAHPDPYHLLKSIIHLSTSSFPIEVKLDGMLQTMAGAFEADRCLLLKSDKIGEKGFLSRLASKREPLWVEEESSFDKEFLPEERALLCPSFVCIPLHDETSFQGILYMGFSKKRSFSSQETELILLVTKEIEQVIRNGRLQQKTIGNVLPYRNLEEIHQELKETQNLLVHREKMAALGELCNSVAHEIKNPLVSIGGFARRLYRAMPEGASEKRYTQSIMIEVGRLERILNDLDHYTRNESMTYHECDLRNVLEDTLSMISEKLDDEDIVVVKEFAENLPKVNGDDHQLKQAFFNIISNSYQAMNGKGTIYLRIHPLSKNGSSFICVKVEDTGKGIDPEKLHNIFNPFYSTKKSGLGLGLPIAHKIILSHRGRVEVDNYPGEKVSFIITLPVIEERKREEIWEKAQ